MLNSLALLLVFATNLCFFNSCFAQAYTQKFDSYVRYMPSADADSLPGEVGIIGSDSEYGWFFKAFDKLPVKFSLAHQYIGIENSTAVELPAHLVGLGTDIETTFPFFNVGKTYFRIGISPSFFGDDWDFKATDFRIPLRALAIYVPDEKWIFVAGLAVYPDFERELLPVAGLIYKPNERLTFNLISRRPDISFTLNKRISLFAEGLSAFGGEFQVDKDKLKDAVLKYRESFLGTGVKYRLNKYAQASFSCGAVFNRYLKYRDSLGKVDIKDATYTEFMVQIKI